MVGSVNVFVAEVMLSPSRLTGRQFLSIDCAEVASEGYRGTVMNGVLVAAWLAI